MGRPSDNERRLRRFELYECFLLLVYGLIDKIMSTPINSIWKQNDFSRKKDEKLKDFMGSGKYYNLDCNRQLLLVE